MTVPVTSLFNEATARSVDSTVTHRKQPGEPRESLRLCEKGRRNEANRQKNASALRSRRTSERVRRSEDTNKTTTRSELTERLADRQKAVSSGRIRREVSWKELILCEPVKGPNGGWGRMAPLGVK